MDQADYNNRLAECSGMWAVARNKRQRRAKEQAQTARVTKTERRNQRKANAIVAIAETLLVAATLAVGLTGYHLRANLPYLGATMAIASAFGAHSFLAPMFTSTFGPAIDRLRGLPPKGAEQ